MNPKSPLWPTLEALDRLWASPAGAAVEEGKAAGFSTLARPGLPGRPKTLIIGAVSPVVRGAVSELGPHCVFQAYPPPLGMRPGDDAALMMDTDLPPFARGSFDLVLLSHVLEYRSTPLALLSLVYEILQPQGRVLVFTPHVLQPSGLQVGHGRRFWDWQIGGLMRQSAFTVQGRAAIRASAWRPATLIHSGAPQVPPRPTGLRPPFNLWEALQRLRRPQGIAASGKTGFRRCHE